MLFRCIQKYDPFNQSDKGTVWDLIAQKMFESTESLIDHQDGDMRVYSNGKSLSVYYARSRDKHKKEDAEGHSGHAGPACDNPESLKHDKQARINFTNFSTIFLILSFLVEYFCKKLRYLKLSFFSFLQK